MESAPSPPSIVELSDPPSAAETQEHQEQQEDQEGSDADELHLDVLESSTTEGATAAAAPPREFEGPRVRGVVQSVRERGKYGLIQLENQEDLVMFTKEFVVDSTGLWQGDVVEFSLMMHQSGQYRAKDVVIVKRAPPREKHSQGVCVTNSS